MTMLKTEATIEGIIFVCALSLKSSASSDES